MDGVLSHRLVSKRYAGIKERLAGKTIDNETLTAILSQDLPGVPKDVLSRDMARMQQGIDQIGAAVISETDATAKEALLSQIGGMKSEEEKKGVLLNLFKMFKQSDEIRDSLVKAADIDSSDIAQLPTDDLISLVGEQLANGVNGMTRDILSAEVDGSVLSSISLKTDDDALILAAAQYEASCDGEINGEFAKIPEVLGACAAAQTKVALYSENVVAAGVDPNDTIRKIILYIAYVLAVLVVIAAVFLALCAASALTIYAMAALTELIGMGTFALIVECILITPIMFASFAAVGLILNGIAIGIDKLAVDVLSPRFPKFKAFYEKLAELFGRSPSGGGGLPEEFDYDDEDEDAFEDENDDAYEDEDEDDEIDE